MILVEGKNVQNAFRLHLSPYFTNHQSCCYERYASSVEGKAVDTIYLYFMCVTRGFPDHERSPSAYASSCLDCFTAPISGTVCFTNK